MKMTVNFTHTLAQTEAAYDLGCRELSKLMANQDAHAIAHTFYRRQIEARPIGADHGGDIESAEMHSAAHLAIIEEISQLKKELDQMRKYADYLRAGGEIDNPFWEDDTSLGYGKSNIASPDNVTVYPIGEEG